MPFKDVRVGIISNFIKSGSNCVLEHSSWNVSLRMFACFYSWYLLSLRIKRINVLILHKYHMK
jgi:hypothetical protein